MREYALGQFRYQYRRMRSGGRALGRATTALYDKRRQYATSNADRRDRNESGEGGVERSNSAELSVIRLEWRCQQVHTMYGRRYVNRTLKNH